MLFLAIVLLQRIAELLVARRNESKVRKKGAIEYDSKGYLVIVAMHAAFFISLCLEYLLLKKSLNSFWTIFILLFVLAQALRYWSIYSLGEFWNTKILVIPGSPLIRKGPYKYIRHPNYAAVTIEIAVIPLVFSCYFTSALFSMLNLALLHRRIKIEERALSTASAANKDD
ncbi:MAG: isoprenylcysteine carboxylmethyltransferase family protein [Deltaproteobacteria bacterium]